MKYITDRLMELQDIGYRDFHCRLMPGIDKELVIGVRSPQIKKLAKEIVRKDRKRALEFMKELPHKYYEENNLHGAFIGLLACDVSEALNMIDEFIPFVDNWATCDSLPPKIFKKDLAMVRERIIPWLESEETYRVRFAVVTMLSYLLEEGFYEEDLDRLAKIKSEEYYINMAIAWYYSFALIKQYERAIRLFESKNLDKWIHNKSIQKAVESYRISQEKKAYLRTLKIK